MPVQIKLVKRPDGIFVAWCPPLPGCVVQSRSEEDAVRKVRQAIKGYLSSLDETLPRELARLFEQEHPDTPAGQEGPGETFERVTTA